MNKLCFLSLLLITSLSINAQKHEACQIIKSDNSIDTGWAKPPQMRDETIKFYSDNTNKEISTEEIKEVQFFIETDTIVYRPIITYKGYRNKKVNNFPTWLKVEVEGAVDLYYGFQTDLNQPNRNMWYLKKKEDEIAYFIAVKYSGGLTMTAGHNNAFKKNASTYLSNHKELSAKIEEGSYKLEDIKKVVDLYNSAKE